MTKLLIRWGIIALAVWVTSLIIPGMDIRGGIQGILMVSLVFGLINAIIKPIVKLLTCPLALLTLGLFTFVVNTLMLMLTAFFLPQYLNLSGSFHGFLTAFIASILISIVTAIMNPLVSDDE